PVHDASPIPPGPHPDLLTGPIPPGPLHPDLSLPRSPPATIPEPGPSAHAVCPHPFGGTRPPLFSSSGSVGSFAGPLQFFPCPATSPEGLHCPRGSFVHAPYCRFHLREIKGLDVAPKQISCHGGNFQFPPTTFCRQISRFCPAWISPRNAIHQQ